MGMEDVNQLCPHPMEFLWVLLASHDAAINEQWAGLAATGLLAKEQ